MSSSVFAATFSRATCTARDITVFARSLTRSDDVAVRFVRGLVMHQEGAVLDQFAAAWQFPWYFGRNWNAFDECMSDLSWINGSAFLTIVLDSDEFLSDAAPDAISVFMRLMNSAKQEWATPLERGESSDRPARNFACILHCDPKNVQSWNQRFVDVRDSIEDISAQICSK